jgi:hypothetical protein
MTDVHQCPRCDLRFADKWELDDHLDADHSHEGPLDDIPDPPAAQG